MISEQDLDKLLQRVAEGSVAPDEARCELRAILEVDDVVLDLERDVRCGQPEVVFGAGKSNSQLRSIVASMAAAGRNVLITRIRAEIAKELAMGYESAQSDEVARTWQLLSAPVPRRCGCVAVVSAGASDAPVSGEAMRTLAFFGVAAVQISDVGVAGIHRLVRRLEEIRECDIVIVVAGMEGALPSVLGGLVAAPVIAVPTSVGYGASFQGLSALLGMLNSCASGITVVNIDNGFGAASAATRMLHLKKE